MMIKIANTKQEKEHAFRVRTIVFVDEQQVPPELEIDEYENDAIHFIGYLENKPVVASRLRFIDYYGKLERICVLKEHRGHSFGKKMIEQMENEIVHRGYSIAKLNAQVHAIDFYKQLGYEVISNEFMDAGIPHMTMIKHLNKNQSNEVI